MIVNPYAGYLLLLAIPIILFYFLKVRWRSTAVSTAMFWDRVFEERQSRSFWKRLRRLLSMLLGLLLLFLLVGAALDPVSSSRQKPTRRVIVIDNSAGMNAPCNAEPSSKSRLDQARAEIRKLLKTSGTILPTAILTAGGSPRLVTGFTNHAETLLRGLESVRPTDQPKSLAETIELARRLVGQEDQPTILVFTDGCSRDLSRLELLSEVRFFPVGQPLDNIGITRFRARRCYDDPVRIETLLETVNDSDMPVRFSVEIDLDGKSLLRVPLAMEPGRADSTVLQSTATAGGVLRATLVPIDREADLFPMDDSAVALLPSGEPQVVCLLEEEREPLLLKALQAQNRVDIRFLSEIPDTVPAGAVLFLCKKMPEIVPKGKIMLIDPRNECDLFELGEPLTASVSIRTKQDSPLLESVRFGRPAISAGRTLIPKSRAEPGERPFPVVLAETDDSRPVYLHWNLPERNVLAFGVDLKRSDLPFQNAFPIMISRALSYFRNSEMGPILTCSTGRPVELALETTCERLVLCRNDNEDPKGLDRRYVPVRQGRIVLGPLPHRGLWELRDPASDAVLARLACNLESRDTSNLRLAPQSFYRSRTEDFSFQAARRPVWFLLALGAMVLALVEWILYQRRWIE